MKRLVYISSARPDLEASDFEAILSTAIAFNTSRNISGLLLFNGLNFLQVLEGKPSNVSRLYAAIVADDRHHGVVTVLEEEIGERAFDDWGMRLKYTPCVAATSPTVKLAKENLIEDLPAGLPPSLRSLLESFNTLKA